MHHRAAVIPTACSVLAHVGTHQAPGTAGRPTSPATIHARLVAARIDSQAVVHGSNGQRLRRVILTW
jgi:hypothetical protein